MKEENLENIQKNITDSLNQFSLEEKSTTLINRLARIQNEKNQFKKENERLKSENNRVNQVGNP